MTHYNVHIYREMRLVFGGIEADSPEAAAAIARDKLTSDADSIDDCDGETFAALIDVAGDEEYEQSRTIDFEPERQRKAAPALLAACRMVIDRWERGDLAEAARACSAAIAQAEAASLPPGLPAPALLASLKAILPYAENEAYALEKHKDGPEAEAEAGRAWQAIEHAHAAIAEANVAGVPSEPPAPKLLAALQMASNYLADDLDETDETEMRVFNAILSAIAAAKEAGISLAPGEMIFGDAPDTDDAPGDARE